MIHTHAIVDSAAELDSSVTVGPFSVIGPGVKIGAGTVIGSNVVIKGPTIIGSDNTILSFVSLGEDPQDKKFAGEPTRLIIGDRNTIREFCSFNRGTVQGNGATVIGDDNLLLSHVHIAHDCTLGNEIIMSGRATLAGHVTVGDYANLSGFAKVHQFCHIGAHSFCGADATILRDVPPYILVGGNPTRPVGINKVGLERRGFNEQSREAIKRAYKILYRSKLPLEAAKERLQLFAEEQPDVAPIVDFLNSSMRGILR